MFEFFDYKYYVSDKLKVYLDPDSLFAILTKKDDDIQNTLLKEWNLNSWEVLKWKLERV